MRPMSIRGPDGDDLWQSSWESRATKPRRCGRHCHCGDASICRGSCTSSTVQSCGQRHHCSASTRPRPCSSTSTGGGRPCDCCYSPIVWTLRGDRKICRVGHNGFSAAVSARDRVSDHSRRDRDRGWSCSKRASSGSDGNLSGDLNNGKLSRSNGKSLREGDIRDDDRLNTRGSAWGTDGIGDSSNTRHTQSVGDRDYPRGTREGPRRWGTWSIVWDRNHDWRAAHRRDRNDMSSDSRD